MFSIIFFMQLLVIFFDLRNKTVLFLIGAVHRQTTKARVERAPHRPLEGTFATLLGWLLGFHNFHT